MQPDSQAQAERDSLTWLLDGRRALRGSGALSRNASSAWLLSF